MAKRGPKKKPLSSDSMGLPTDPPEELGLDHEQAKAYRTIASKLHHLGIGTVADSRAVALAACSAATLSRLEREMSAAPSLTVLGAHGPKSHPILGEVRNERKVLGVMLDRLLLSPKSRRVARVKDEPADNRSDPSEDSLEDLLGG